MKKLLSIAATLIIIFYMTSTNAQSLSNSQTREIKHQIKQLMRKDHVSGLAIAIIDHGTKRIYVFGKMAGSKPKPITEDTQFEIGSITKLMTTLVLAEEVQQGRAKLTDSVAQYLPQLSGNSNIRNITLQQLATHTSGFPFVPPDAVKTKMELNNYLLNWKPTSKIYWSYSNIGMGLLGDSLAAQKHQSVSQLFENDIFLPLHMTASGMDVRPYLILLPAAGYVESSITDMSKFLAAAIGLPSVPENIVTAMRLAQTPRVQVGSMRQALGWQVYSLQNRKKLLDTSQYPDLLAPVAIGKLPKNQQIYNPNTLIDKTGRMDSFRSYIAVIPSQQSGVVILFNNPVAPISPNDLIYTGRKILFMFS